MFKEKEKKRNKRKEETKKSKQIQKSYHALKYNVHCFHVTTD